MEPTQAWVPRKGIIKESYKYWQSVYSRQRKSMISTVRRSALALERFGRRKLTEAVRRVEWRFSRRRDPQVTIVSQFFPPDFAATGQLLSDLCESLAENGHKVQVITGMPSYAYKDSRADRVEFRNGYCIRRTNASRLWPSQIRGRAINGLLFIARIATKLMRRSRRGDVVILTSEPPYLGIAGWLLLSLTRTPYILIVYDLYPDVAQAVTGLRKDHPLFGLWKRLNRLMYSHCKSAIVLSEGMKEKLLRSYPEAAGKTEVIHSWCIEGESRSVTKENNWFARKHNLENKFVVMYSGNQGRCHDLVTPIAAAMLLRERKDIIFLIIGGGYQNKRIRDLVKDWELKNCSFLPYQEREDLHFSLAAGDIALVTLGVEAEGLVAPSKLYGHVAKGTPIAAITPQYSELGMTVEEGQFGKWFKNGDAEELARWIEELKENKVQRERYGANGLKWLHEKANKSAAMEMYEKLISVSYSGDT